MSHDLESYESSNFLTRKNGGGVCNSLKHGQNCLKSCVSIISALNNSNLEYFWFLSHSHFLPWRGVRWSASNFVTFFYHNSAWQWNLGKVFIFSERQHIYVFNHHKFASDHSTSTCRKIQKTWKNWQFFQKSDFFYMTQKS